MIELSNLKYIGFNLNSTLYFPQANSDIREPFCDRIAKELEINKNHILSFYDENVVNCKNSSQIIRALRNLRIPQDRLYNIYLDVLDECEKISPFDEENQLGNIFKKLNKRYNLFLLTKNRPMNAIKKLKSIGLPQSIFKFEPVYGSENKRRALELMLKWMNVPASEVMYVGSSEYSDIKPAKSLGMLAVKVTKEDEHTQADFKISSVFDLEKLLKKPYNIQFDLGDVPKSYHPIFFKKYT